MGFFELYGTERMIILGRELELHGIFYRFTGCGCSRILVSGKNILRKITKREQFCFLL